jgi:FkbM family methyltransferase
MLRRFKQLARSASRWCAELIGRTRIGRIFLEEALAGTMTRSRRVTHRGTELLFAVPNSLCEFRVRTFTTKEPETLAWLDSIPENAVLWDIGANIGLYSCYAAKARGCRVIAFEPSVFNLELLARNAFLNGLSQRVTIVSLPLFANLTESTLNMTTTEWGGALSTFGASYGHDGRPMAKVFEFRTVGLPMDDFVSRLALPEPQYIKLDVDGIEHLVLQGGRRVLRGVQSLSVEVNDAFSEHARACRQLLEESGMRFVSKAHSALIASNPAFNTGFNQVWAR